jgi:two-component system NtrC family response regulator
VREVEQGDYDLVFLDVLLPDGNGLEALPRIKQSPGSPEVIIITAVGDADGAELSINSGAWDYVQKPLSMPALKLSLNRALEYRETKRRRSRAVVLKRREIIGSSRELENSLGQLAEAADSDVTVLITGQTGTGKELFARALHDNSPRSGGPFVVVDCASLPTTLAESVLFGHKRGAFTGADRDRTGLFTQAHRGTVFLDEIGDLPSDAQRVLLRALQERRFRPVGAQQEIHSDFRLVAATNRDLDRMVESGGFREDLLYRLKGFVIHLPSLMDRAEDLKELVTHFMVDICEQAGMPPKVVTPEFLGTLQSYGWPGNVRELRQVMERSLASAGSEGELLPAHLPTHIRAKAVRASVRGGAGVEHGDGPGSGRGMPEFRDFRNERVNSAEKEYLDRLIEFCGGEPAEAMRISGLSKTRLYELLKKHGKRLTG